MKKIRENPVTVIGAALAVNAAVVEGVVVALMAGPLAGAVAAVLAGGLVWTAFAFARPYVVSAARHEEDVAESFVDGAQFALRPEEI